MKTRNEVNKTLTYGMSHNGSCRCMLGLFQLICFLAACQTHSFVLGNL